MKPLDLIGKKFTMLKVISRGSNNKHGQSRFNCLCDCGNYKLVDSRSLMSGKQLSCGCYSKSIIKTIARKHGESNTKIYLVWKEMRARCTRPTHKRYSDYGGRGINVCERWLTSFINFKKDMGERPVGYTIERINNNGDYTPSNCKWATYKEQNKNKR